MGGLAAAKAVAPYFDKVTVLDRDALPEGPDARRVTFGNAVFRFLGVIAVAPFVPRLAAWIATIESDAARQVVDFHLLFNLAIAAVFLFLVKPAAALLQRLVPSSDAAADDPGRPRYLDRAAMDTPNVALTCAARETLHMGDIVEEMLRLSMTAPVWSYESTCPSGHLAQSRTARRPAYQFARGLVHKDRKCPSR